MPVHSGDGKNRTNPALSLTARFVSIAVPGHTLAAAFTVIVTVALAEL
jgi:hypothetical protein